ncbi:MAG TPA: STAS/SEC14 domain-containing protein, partial [Bacillus bacterium]|nr:STAS/SEC14 domain-containing protein [Bacillus sp. (in: firmicutes)]
MIEILHSRDPSTIALVFSGKATEQDAEVLDGYVKVSFKEDEKFNILAIMKDVDGSTFKGMIDGVTFDMKRWSQFNKFAVISEKDWIGFM